MIDGLKLCPFCGGAAKRNNDGFYKYFVGCGNHFCPIHPVSSSDASQEECDSGWNTRACEKRQEGGKIEEIQAVRGKPAAQANTQLKASV